MYSPEVFREDDPAVLRRIMNDHPFATLITYAEGAPFAGHLPFLHRDDGSPHGTLYTHVSRANPQWRHVEAGGAALVAFQGPHTYVSPSWYQEQPAVPTWNYVAVHAHGTPALLDDGELRALLGELVAVHERRLARPWSMAELPEAYVTRMLAGIVGIRVKIERLEGKLKLSQNRRPEDRRRVADQLRASDDAQALDVARWMDELSKHEPGPAPGR